MSVLGKDLFDFQRSHTNTKVEFGASGYWVEMIPEMQPYGTVLTEILNLDVTPFQKLLDRLNTAVHEKNYDDAPRAYMDMQKGFGSLPLYRLYLMDFRYFGDMKIEEFVGKEVREAFAKYVINEEREIPSFMQQQIKDIQLIQERYAWFLDRVFANAVFEKKKGQRKESLAQLIYSSGYEAFVSGVSLGKDPEVDAPLVRAQYRIRGSLILNSRSMTSILLLISSSPCIIKLLKMVFSSSVNFIAFISADKESNLALLSSSVFPI